ncbi:MAG TPA: hypothetical protein VFQ76_20990 [Longimicrobiaceae bacterium]|nr:hypothetical protein [Longimicrobiaceae bacterium]
MSTPYPPPVARLLELGIKATDGTWMDYLELGLGPEHVPDLIRMATNEQLNDGDAGRPETWAPVHAWRALGQLRAESAVEPLMELAGKLEDDDYAQGDLDRVFGMIGRAAVPALSRVLTDPRESSRVRAVAARGLDQVLVEDESTRDEVEAALVAAMEQWEGNDEDLNAWVVDALVEHQVVEAAPLMERAFAAGRVDLLLRGDWEDVQVELGLIEERQTPPVGMPAPRSFVGDGFASGPAPRLRSPDSKAKRKRKQQKESRKKNRRRK